MYWLFYYFIMFYRYFLLRLCLSCVLRTIINFFQDTLFLLKGILHVIQKIVLYYFFREKSNCVYILCTDTYSNQ